MTRNLLRADGVHCRETAGVGSEVFKVFRVTGAVLQVSLMGHFLCASFPTATTGTLQWICASIGDGYYYCKELVEPVEFYVEMHPQRTESWPAVAAFTNRSITVEIFSPAHLNLVSLSRLRS